MERETGVANHYSELRSKHVVDSLRSMTKLLCAAIILSLGCVLSLSSGRSAVAQVVDAQVIGGTNAADGEFSWIVLLHKKAFSDPGDQQFLCAGSLIAPEWIVTASHCVSPPYSTEGQHNPPLSVTPSSFYVTFGSNSSISGRYKTEIADIVLPTSGYTFNNDIALIRLARPINSIAPVSLVTPNLVETAMTVGTAMTAGWGATNFGVEQLGAGVYPERLQKAALTLFNDAQCLTALGTSYIADRTLCAAVLASDDRGTGARDSCYGDSGGPLVVSISGVQKLLGIVSGGYMCGSDKYPGMYTEVPHYSSFIDLTTNPSDRIGVLASTIVEKLRLALNRRSSITDDMSREQIDRVERQIFKQSWARTVIERYLASIVLTTSKDSALLRGVHREISLSSLKVRQRKLIRAMNLAEQNRLPKKESAVIVSENIRFFSRLRLRSS
jgi:secreted trypsin-like serine protease